MNLNDGDDDPFVTQHCLELANLLRTEQTEQFLDLYDSLPSEWTGEKLERVKERIREFQEYDNERFQSLYQYTFSNRSSSIMSNPTSPSTIIRKTDHLDQPSRITSLPLLQQKQHNERITANNLACDETHELTTKHSSTSNKKNMDELNTKTRRLQPITNNNPKTHDSRTHTPVDSFVQLNLKPAIDIKLEDYKKARDTTMSSVSKTTSSINQRFSDSNESNQQNTNTVKNCDDLTDLRTRSRSSSSSSINLKSDLLLSETFSQSNTFGHGKLLAKTDLDSHGSSIATKSSSENSGSARTGSDSDDEHQQSDRQILSSQYSRDKSFNNYDDTPTIVLNQISENRPSQHGRITSLPDQNSYELVKLNSSDESPSLRLLPRFKQPASDDPNGITNSTHDYAPYTTQRSQPNQLTSSSHPNQNPERHEQYNPNHSNSSSRKPSSRSTKKRKQSQQQEIIRTELIPGHRGDLDVDELVMFIDGNLSSKTRQNSATIRSTDTNSNTNNVNSNTSRRKSRKSSKTLSDHLNKSSTNEDDIQSIDFPDDDNRTNTTTHSLPEQISLPDDDESHSNTTNGDVSLPEWHSTSSVQQDEIDFLSISSTTLNNSNSETLSEPFVTVTHRRRLIKERRPENNNNNNNSSSSSSFRTARFSDKRRFQPPVQNGIGRSTISNNKSTVSIPTKDDHVDSTPPLPPSTVVPVSSMNPPPPTTSGSNHVPEQSSSSPRLSSHSSSSSLSSLLKRQSKAPPVVFLNKSADIELNGVSFGFDVDNPPSKKSPTPPPVPPPSSSSSLPSSEPAELNNEKETDSTSPSSRPSYQQQQQRHPRGPFFYSGSDIRPPLPAHRTYPSQSSYMDPLLFFPYNQHYAYMNLLRTPYLSSQSSYVFIPTAPTYEANNSEDKEQTSETIQEPLLVYATMPGQTGPMYYQSTKKSFQSMYPSAPYYPTHPAYFQPIPSSSSLSMENKSQHDETDNEEDVVVDDDEDPNGDKSHRKFEQNKTQSSSQIMSNALQLVYSQEKLNAQTDRFNLDQLTAYLAMKWTDTIDHYEQGDDEILLVSSEQ